MADHSNRAGDSTGGHPEASAGPKQFALALGLERIGLISLAVEDTELQSRALDIATKLANGGVTINLGNQSEGFILTGSAYKDILTGGQGTNSIDAGDGEAPAEILRAGRIRRDVPGHAHAIAPAALHKILFANDAHALSPCRPASTGPGS